MTFYDELTERDLLLSAWQTLRRIESTLAAQTGIELPAPKVTVLPPDLTGVVNAVNQLKPGVDAEDIAAALARVLRPGEPQPLPGVEEFQAAVKELSFRLKGFGTQAYGGGSVSLLPNQSVSVANQLVPAAYDEIVLTYTGDNVTGAVYKQGGATVATLAMTYVGDNITRVVRS